MLRHLTMRTAIVPHLVAEQLREGCASTDIADSGFHEAGFTAHPAQGEHRARVKITMGANVACMFVFISTKLEARSLPMRYFYNGRQPHHV